MKSKRMPDGLVESLAQTTGRRFAEMRRARGWTQRFVAERLGVSTRHLRRWESGINMRVNTVERLAKTVGVTPGELAGP